MTYKPYGTPKFTTQPKNTTAKIGTKVTFSVKTDIDTGWPSYQWQISTDNGKTWTDYTGTGAKTAKISVTIQENLIGNMYRCVVTDGICGETTTSKTAQIRTPVAIAKQPVDAFVNLNEQYTATVEATGKGLTYTWYYKNASATSFSKSSLTTNTYTGTMKESNASRQLYCVITDAFGNTVTTDIVKVLLNNN